MIVVEFLLPTKLCSFLAKLSVTEVVHTPPPLCGSQFIKAPKTNAKRLWPLLCTNFFRGGSNCAEKNAAARADDVALDSGRVSLH